ncbi:MAG: DUF362 domain-containing protein [Bacteroidia bacterium]|nr:DUF362 domain-containing protein [Bacteroidia bacterium]
MKRRDFFKKSIGAGVAGGLTFMIGSSSSKLLGNSFLMNDPAYDLVAVKGGEPDLMFDKAIESLGGMGKFVKKGQTVVVKPNMGWDVAPEMAANTNPKLIGRIVKLCYNAGAKKVMVFDNTCDQWQKCYKNSGIEKAAKDAGAEVVPGNAESYYHEVEIKNGKNLKKAKVHELILESNVFINVPVIKHHSSADITLAMKNLMGVVWDRRYWHRNNLHQCIADFSSYCKPTLNVIDGYRIMMRNGPRGVSGEDVTLSRSLILSTDIVAADAAGVKIFGSDPKNIDYLRIASEMKSGEINLEKLNINRIKL